MRIVPAEPGWYVAYPGESGEARLPVIAWGIEESGRDSDCIYVLSHDDTGDPCVGPLSASKAPMYFGVFHERYRGHNS